MNNAETQVGDEASSLAKAAERIRGSAQWLLGAFAAVGAVLAAGLQLADIGDLSFDDVWRLVAGIGGVAIAVIGIIIAIAAAASVSTKSYVTLQWLLQHPKSRAAQTVEGDEELIGRRSIAQLRSEVVDALRRAEDTYGEIVALGDPRGETTKEATARALNERYTQETARLQQARTTRAEVLDVASYHRVSEAYDRAKVWMSLGAILAALGMIAFAWGSNPPEDDSIEAGDVVPKLPSEVTVILTDEGQEMYGEALGEAEGCELANLGAIAFAVDRLTYDVVSEATDECNVVRMEITDELGTVVPRVEAEADPATPASG